MLRTSSLSFLFSPLNLSQSIRTRLRVSLFAMGAAQVETVNTSKRLAGLRELMNQKENAVKAYVVPSEDQRMSFD